MPKDLVQCQDAVRNELWMLAYGLKHPKKAIVDLVMNLKSISLSNNSNWFTGKFLTLWGEKMMLTSDYDRHSDVS
jgi:hypothetical protein